MSEDLIKRSDAIKAIEECLKLLARPRYTVKTAIEAIPSVDIPQSDDWEKYSDKLWKLAYERGKADRPQGEWIRTGRTNIYGGIEVQCSNCGDKVMVQHLEDEWYCRHCGADMGMKGVDDEYERAVEQMEYDMLYEPTYNPEDGSM